MCQAWPPTRWTGLGEGGQRLGPSRRSPGLIRGSWRGGAGGEGLSRGCAEAQSPSLCEIMGRGLNSARLRRQKRRLRHRVQKPRPQPEVSGHQGGPLTPMARGEGSQHLLWGLETSLYCAPACSPSLRICILLSACFLPASDSLTCLRSVSPPGALVSVHLISSSL